MVDKCRAGKAGNPSASYMWREGLPKFVRFSGTEIKWLEQPQARNPFETIHISRHQFPTIFQRRGNQDGIGQADFSLLPASITLLAACHQWERLRD
jgi:hypothetical protein